MGSADAFILVYDITSKETFDEAKMIRDQIHECKGTSAVPIVVVGNKIDLLSDNNDLREVIYCFKFLFLFSGLKIILYTYL